MSTPSLIRFGFIAVGLSNILSVLIFSLSFSNQPLFSIDPTVISPLALFMVMLWGAAAIVVSPMAARLPTLSLVFALEKLSYVVVWVVWLGGTRPSLSAIYEQDLLSGLFFSIYGPFDFLLMSFFLWAASAARQANPI